VVPRTLKVTERSLYSIRSLTFSKWRDLRIGSDICGFRSLNNSTSKKVLNLLEPVKLIVGKVVIKIITKSSPVLNG